MHNAYKLGKKAISWGVVATTIAWSVGAASLVAPLAASAAVSLPSGSLIKGSLPAVYYLAGNGKRYVFPSQKTYNTWYPDFSGVTTITDADLATISIGGNVVHRAGTRLVKIQSDPKTYAVEPGGTLRWVTSESVALALWGSTWNTKIDDVSDAFFTNYRSGADVTSNTYPTGSLVKMSGSADVYYIDGTSKRKVTAAGWTANRFQDRYVVTTSLDLSVYTNGTDISAGDPNINDVSQLGLGGGTPPTSGSGLTLSTASGNPMSATVVTDTVDGAQAAIGALKLRFSAAADGSVTVTTLKVRRGGISSDADLKEIYLYDGDSTTMQLARSTSISAGVVTFTNASGLFTVPAGGSKEVMVRFDLSTNVTAGKTISLSVEAADIVASSTGTAISGSAMGNTFTVASVTDLGQLELVNVQPTAAGTVEPATDFELWRFRMDANDQELIVKSVTITNAGSIDGDDIQNFKLMDGATQLGSTVPALVNGKLVFDFSGMTDGGYKITSGQSKQLSLRGDILGGTNRTFRFGVRNSADVIVWDKAYQVYTIPVKDGQETFAVVEPNSSGTAVDTTISTGRLTIQVASDSPSTNVPDGATGVLMAKWTLTAAGEDVKISTITPNCSAADGTTILKNVKLLFDGVQVGSTDTTETCDNSGATEFSFGNSLVVPAGSTKTLSYYADLTDSTVATNDTITANLEAPASANAEGRVSLTSISTSAASGRTLTVKSGALVASEDASFTDRNATTPSGVLGAQGVTIGQFVVTGGGEDADITQIILTEDVSGAGNTMADTFQNLKLWKVNADGTTTQVGSTFGSLTDTDATTNTFTPSAAIRLGAGATMVFKITADIKTNGTVLTADGVVYPSKVSATGVVTGTDVSDSDGTGSELQNVHILTNGNLSIYPDSATPVRTTYAMGNTGKEFSRFKFEASINEDIDVTKIVVSDFMQAGAIAATGTLKNIKLIDASTGTQYGGTIASLDGSSSSIAPVAIFENISNLRVERSNAKVLKVVADASSYIDGGVSSSSHRMSIFPTYVSIATGNDSGTVSLSLLSITATGRDSGFSISGTSLDFNSNSSNTNTDALVNGSSHDVFRAKLTVAKHASSPSGVTSGASEQTVARFVVTNESPGNYTATLNLMDLDVGSTISGTTTRNIKVYKDSVTSGNLLATTNGCTNVGGTCIWGDTDFNHNSAADSDAFDDVDVSVGSREIYVTADTSDAATDKRLTVGLDTGDIRWTDGVTTNISTVDSLPIAGNTLSY